jgi:hypothetical protein
VCVCVWVWVWVCVCVCVCVYVRTYVNLKTFLHTYLRPTTYIFTSHNIHIYVPQHTYLRPTTYIFTSHNIYIYVPQHTYLRPTTYIFTSHNIPLIESQDIIKFCSFQTAVRSTKLGLFIDKNYYTVHNSMQLSYL